MKKNSVSWSGTTIGVDLGDRTSRMCVLDTAGEIVEEAVIATTRSSFERRFARLERARVVLETGSHAGWANDVLEQAGHEVIVANARKVRSISSNERKCDELDARMLAQLGRVDARLLCPVEVRKSQQREDLMLVRARSAAVESRTALINSVRGLAKASGFRLKARSSSSFHKEALDPSLRAALRPLMSAIEHLTKSIARYDKQIARLCWSRYPQTRLLTQVHGVGELTALYFVLLIGDTARFERPRDVGAYLGLVPRRDQSGAKDPQLRISKTGDRLGRVLLVQCAHYILGPFGKDSDLRRFGEKIAARGGKAAKKRAVVATARKLAVVLFALLRKGEVYEPLRNASKTRAA